MQMHRAELCTVFEISGSKNIGQCEGMTFFDRSKVNQVNRMLKNFDAVNLGDKMDTVEHL